MEPTTIGPITEVCIHDELNKAAAGHKLLEKFTLFKLQNRVKYERRKKMHQKLLANQNVFE